MILAEAMMVVAAQDKYSSKSDQIASVVEHIDGSADELIHLDAAA